MLTLRRIGLLLGFPALFIGLHLLITAQGAVATGGHPWDLRFIDQAGQFSFYDYPAGASATGKPVDVGDFDGDGCGDLAITGQNASHGVSGFWRGSGGHVRIVMNFCDISGQLAINLDPATFAYPV